MQTVAMGHSAEFQPAAQSKEFSMSVDWFTPHK